MAYGNDHFLQVLAGKIHCVRRTLGWEVCGLGRDCYVDTRSVEGDRRVDLKSLRYHSRANRSHYQAEVISALGPLIRVNHGLLVSLGVSHPRIERVCQLVDDAQIGWTKLTGAGGVQTLAAEGFKTNEIVPGADGVGVLWPAVFHTNGVTGKKFQDIDLEKFENAVDAQEIEELVGYKTL
ncbi:hypothetical protein N7528_001130 [Penicillium herquei]|nr:hypothetical protein N7528_001130 [Penicillium herquei]